MYKTTILAKWSWLKLQSQMKGFVKAWLIVWHFREGQKFDQIMETNASVLASAVTNKILCANLFFLIGL